MTTDKTIRRIRVAGKPLRVEIADTPEKRTQGLMGRRSIGNDGMLFIMDDGPASFHMRSTFIPLDIVFFDIAGRVIKIDQMEPLVGRSTCSRPVSSVLELPAGSCDKLGITVGSKLVEGSSLLDESLLRDVISEMLDILRDG